MNERGVRHSWNQDIEIDGTETGIRKEPTSHIRGWGPFTVYDTLGFRDWSIPGLVEGLVAPVLKGESLGFLSHFQGTAQKISLIVFQNAGTIHIRPSLDPSL